MAENIRRRSRTMMTRLVCLIMISASGVGFSNLPDDPVEYANWESKMLASVSSQQGKPPDEAVPKLGTWVMQLSQIGTPNWEKGDRPVFHAAQAALLAIPGHAEYYRDRILRARGDAKSVVADINAFSIKFSAFSNEKSRGFETLGQLPSAETVRVLGEFLSDEWVSPIPIQDKIMDSPLSHSAVISLANLPLVSKPADTKYGYQAPTDHGTWLSWYEQIKSGNRTFHFEGDPTEYDLNGPAPKDKLVRIERDRKRDAERSAGHKKATPGFETESAMAQISKPSIVAWILAVAGLCAVAVWYFLRGRKTA